MKKLSWMIILVPQLVWAIQTNAVPGGIAAVTITKKFDYPPKVYFNKHRVMLLKQQDHWVAMVGIPLSETPGKHSINIRTHFRTFKETFEVHSKDYPEQYITIKNQEMVNPTKAQLTRIDKERQETTKVFSTWRDTENVPQTLEWPVKGRVSSKFGLRQYFSHQEHTPHSGVDIAVPLGTPVKTAAPGFVEHIGDYYLNRKTVFIDHGQGLITMYSHLQRILVKNGQHVLAHQVIGLVGKSGRATDPHLHWEVSLNNARVNPELFIAKK